MSVFTQISRRIAPLRRLLHLQSSPRTSPLASFRRTDAKPSGQPKKGPITWLSVGALVATGASVLIYAEYLKQEKKKRATESKELSTIGKPALGGPFVLLDSKGKTVTTLDFQGKWLLIYFGFTFCPQICPDELAKISDAIDQLEKSGGPTVTPVFISIDPERDTPEKVGEYIKDFHPRFVALTGSPSQIADVCKKFRVYYTKTTPEGSEDYMVDHSIISYLVDGSGSFVQYFGKNKTAADIVAEIKRLVPS